MRATVGTSTTQRKRERADSCRDVDEAYLVPMSFQIAERVADALLFDALLHPGGDPFAVAALAPRAAADDGAHFCAEARWLMRRHAGRVDVRLRFLQHERKTIEAIAGVDLVPVDALDLGPGALALPCDQLAPIHRDFSFTFADVAAAGPRGLALSFDVPGSVAGETLTKRDVVVGRVVRRTSDLTGLLRVFLEEADGGDALARLIVRVENTTPYVEPPAVSADDNARVLATLHAVHLVAESEAGAFLSTSSTSDAAHPSAGDDGGIATLTTLVLGGAGAGGLALSAPFLDHAALDDAHSVSAAPVRVLVAAVGDPRYGDDGVGRAIVEALRKERLLRGLAVVDCGTSANELADHLASTPPELLILAGAVARGGPPGTVYAIDAALLDERQLDQRPSTPAAMLHAVRELVASPPAMTVVGVEPLAMIAGKPLSPAVEHAIAAAVSLVKDVIAHALGRDAIEGPAIRSQPNS
jgi:hydrogenase maturation protease